MNEDRGGTSCELSSDMDWLVVVVIDGMVGVDMSGDWLELTVTITVLFGEDVGVTVKIECEVHIISQVIVWRYWLNCSLKWLNEMWL